MCKMDQYHLQNNQSLRTTDWEITCNAGIMRPRHSCATILLLSTRSRPIYYSSSMQLHNNRYTLLYTRNICDVVEQ